MTHPRKLFPWKHTTGKYFTRPLLWALCGTILLGLFLIANPRSAEAFSQKAVDRLFSTKKCVRCDLRSADLTGKDLRAFKLMGAYLIGANLSDANLAGADLRGIWLMRAKLRSANLKGADLRGAHLVGADLTNANLQLTNLKNAKLGRAILTGSTLKKAILSGSNLQATKLDRVRDLKQTQIDRACGDAATVLPSGISISSCRNRVR